MKVVPLGAGVREPVLLAVAFLSGFSPTPELGGGGEKGLVLVAGLLYQMFKHFLE